ncbi:Glycosyltransferase involved in cell wall bisynthesis [Palleronia salina]|uniref:Glycosyltransferase involved in cell wall bisynthesis n=1 Tax=Palleronia salina TaxID=313368 RepID=A0A1M6DIR1_9RHOB|nr:glycosyltransferase [Palleronia salina]SHI72898.1 Glycosyltransferase involved in cell wall bisynthesis [Palleronia salina]
MVFLFLHQNFPGQFAHLAPALAAKGHQVFALSSRFTKPDTWRGVRLIPYAYAEPKDQKLHPWLNTMNRAVDRGTVVLRAALALKARGLMPDAIVAHSGWGEALFLREVWPDARIGIFCEFFYATEGADVDFDPEFANPNELGRGPRMMFKNMAMRMQLDQADAGFSPTHWQADSHPPELRQRLTVLHDGIDTDAIRPDPEVRLTLEGHGSWTRDDEVVTFVNRNLEPYRGFHVFMRILPELLRRRPKAQVIVVGEDGLSYGSPPKEGGTWKDKMIAEVRGRIPDADWARVHFTGRVARGDFTRLLQVARVHLYLTYPFVLSWSALEAMACEAAIVASDTAPVREVMRHDETALLVDFFDREGMVDAIDRLLSDPDKRRAMGKAARAHVVDNYDLKRACLPRQFEWVDKLVAPRD